MNKIIILMIVAMLLIPNIIILTQIREQNEWINNQNRLLGFMCRGANITESWSQHYGRYWVLTIFQVQEGFYGYSIDPDYLDADVGDLCIQWVNRTLDYNTFKVLDGSWEKYAFSQKYDRWVGVQYYAM